MRAKQKYSYIEGWVSIAVNVALFIFKWYAGIVSRSVALQADAMHTLSDSISSVFILIGAKISNKPPDQKHPFGHGRAELITALSVGMLLSFVAYEFFRESIAKLLHGQAAEYGRIAVIATITSILIKELLAQFAFFFYRKTGSKPLKADAWHHRSDALSSVIMLMGIFFNRYFWWIDGVLGTLIALFIFYTALTIILEAVNPLLGKTPDSVMVSNIKSICDDAYGAPLNAHHFHLHEYGDHSELTFHIVLPAEYSLRQSHALADLIETTIREKLNIEATIHMESSGDDKDQGDNSGNTQSYV
ncbi:MAG: cation diffusion facilitator family transporter [candidate division KSB1 bacterium]|nr:cation diffusion facilitator family transporter [candidate division KSB1 bacterium]